MKHWGLCLLFCAMTGFAQPAQIILLRHGEEPADKDDVHLSQRGEERARALAQLLARPSPLTSNAPIAALFATEVTKGDRSHRTSETLTPLGHSLKLPVQTPFHSKDFARLAARVLSDPAFRGKTVVICWTHHNLPEFAGALGVKPELPAWKNKVFDRLWVINFSANTVQLRDQPQRLLPGDSKK